MMPRLLSKLAAGRLLLSATALLCACLGAGAQTDSLSFLLKESSISESLNTSPIRGDILKEIRFDTESVAAYPKSLGEFDALTLLQSFPGVAGNAEMAPGLFVMGCDNSHNLFSVAGAPIYYSPRLLGLFSSFNMAHFHKTSFKTMSEGPHLGASLNFEPADTLATVFSGSANLSPLSSNISLAIPLGEKMTATLSARKAFLNIFYRGLISIYNSPVLYDFWDVNANVLYRPGPKDAVDANFLASQDVTDLQSSQNMFGADATWGDQVASLRWRHSGIFSRSHMAYATRHYRKSALMQGDLRIDLPSDLMEYGYKSSMDLGGIATLKFAASSYDLQPQSPSIAGSTSPNDAQPRMKASLLSADLEKQISLGRWGIVPAVSATRYHEITAGKPYFHVDPQLTVTSDFYKAGKVTLEAGRKHQYFTETGMLTSGIPVQFWMASGSVSEPQESRFANLSHALNLLHGEYTLTTEIYGKQLLHQLEYTGFIFDMVVREYNLEDQIVETQGKNYGVNLMLSKNRGDLTGWVSYAFGRALRKGIIDGTELEFPSSHERIHELDAVANWKVRDLDFCVNYTMASGQPFTPVKQLYVINNNLLAEYYPYNSGRLAPVIRMDLSVNFNMKPNGRYHQGINFSIHNLFNTDNQFSYFLDVTENGQFRYAPYYLAISVIPSLSYFCSF